MSETGLTIRSYKKGDLDEIYNLMSSIVKHTPKKENWMDWREYFYMNNPNGASKIWLAVYDGKIIGHDALILKKIKIGKEVINGSQNVDLLVHPNYRRRGVFTSLGEKTFRDAEKENIDITYGFPNEQARLGHLKQGWFDVCRMQRFIKPLNVKNIFKRYVTNKYQLQILTLIGNLLLRVLYGPTKPSKKGDFIISSTSSFDDGINDFWRNASEGYNIILVRDRDYLNWRYSDMPNVNYTIYVAKEKEKICGFIVLKLVKKRELMFGIIFDVLAPINKKKVIECLVSRAIGYFRENNADLIICDIIAPEIYYQALKKNGFIRFPFTKKRNRFIARVNTSKIPKEYIQNSRNWFIQTGDSDRL